jgi:hypothetical protein
MLWDDNGVRVLPRHAALRAALLACEERDAWWVCEASRAGPLYFLPTVEWIDVLCSSLRDLGVTKVLEVAAGDGFLSSCLSSASPKLRVIATDNHAWTRVSARMNDADRKRVSSSVFSGIVAAAHVEKRTVSNAIAHHRPDITLISWAPPGVLVERAIQAPRSKLVLDISTDGDVCGNGMSTWRYRKEFLDGPIEATALCRLDGGANAHAPSTRITMYYGRAHKLHGRE